MSTQGQNQYYDGQSKFLISVDCIIFQFDKGDLKLLTFRRKLKPYEGGLSLLGGFIFDGENIDQAANRVVHELTGLDNIYLRQVGAYGNIDRDPGERVISIVYLALVTPTEYSQEIIDNSGASWMTLNQGSELIFDHKQMVDDAILQIRQEAATRPILFNLLPERFTLPQLQSLYEAVYGVELDKRNFRKKILAMNVLIQLDEKDKDSSKRGAYYYVFDKEQYEKLSNQGIAFSV